jgi:solute:Na+ symporter, SSS family
MIICSFIFIPFYWRAGVYSVPEYLGKRYNDIVRVISAVIFCMFNVVIVGIFLWAAALMLETYLGWPKILSIFVTAIVVGLYTISGGLKAVVVTDSLQVILMFIGAIAIGVVGINQVGGVDVFIDTLTTKYPNHLKAFLPSDHPDYPWPGVFLGLGLVLSPAYWCTNQAILQRSLGAKTEWDSKASMIFAAFLKSFVPFLTLLPGLLALIMIKETLPNSDQALPWIIKNVLPVGLSGLMFISFIGALQSSIDSTMNSASVMITRDIVGVLKKEELTDEMQLKYGKLFTFCVLIFGMIFAPLSVQFKGIYNFLQIALSLFQGPIWALMIMGILTKSATAKAGLITLVTGLIFALICHLNGVNMFYIAFWSCIFSMFSIWIISLKTDKKSDSELKNLTFHTSKKSE